MTLQLKGLRFGRLVALERETVKTSDTFNWKCICDCGNFTSVKASRLKYGWTKSCGCLLNDRRRTASISHGMRRSAEYNIWCGMKARCYNRNNEAYDRYGGRGIRVADHWLESFENFYEDMGPRPSPEYSIERIDNNWHYTPRNCIWANNEDQANNRRSNRYIDYLGETKTVAEWAREYGLTYPTLSKRLKNGRTMEEAINFKNRRYSENRS